MQVLLERGVSNGFARENVDVVRRRERERGRGGDGATYRENQTEAAEFHGCMHDTNKHWPGCARSTCGKAQVVGDASAVQCFHHAATSTPLAS